jgi:hypothetical protein
LILSYNASTCKEYTACEGIYKELRVNFLIAPLSLSIIFVHLLLHFLPVHLLLSLLLLDLLLDLRLGGVQLLVEVVDDTRPPPLLLLAACVLMPQGVVVVVSGGRRAARTTHEDQLNRVVLEVAGRDNLRPSWFCGCIIGFESRHLLLLLFM